MWVPICASPLPFSRTLFNPLNPGYQAQNPLLCLELEWVKAHLLRLSCFTSVMSQVHECCAVSGFLPSLGWGPGPHFAYLLTRGQHMGYWYSVSVDFFATLAHVHICNTATTVKIRNHFATIKLSIGACVLISCLEGDFLINARRWLKHHWGGFFSLEAYVTENRSLTPALRPWVTKGKCKGWRDGSTMKGSPAPPWQLSTTRNSSSRGSNALFWLPQALHTAVHEGKIPRT